MVGGVGSVTLCLFDSGVTDELREEAPGLTGVGDEQLSFGVLVDEGFMAGEKTKEKR